MRHPLLTVAFLLPMLAYAYVGLFARYAADDFCTASTLFDRGFVGAQQFWYINWTGRFIFTALIDALDWLGSWTVPLTSTLLLAAWVAASAAALSPLLARISIPNSRAQSVLLALVLTSITLGGAPALWQSLYWQTGAISYLLPIIMATLYVRTVWQAMQAWRAGQSRMPWLVVGALLVVLMGGTSETALIVLGGSLALGLGGAILVLHPGQTRRALLSTLGVGLAAAVLTGAVVLAAPGNANRAAVFVHPGLDSVVAGATLYPFWLLLNFFVQVPALVVLAYAVPFLMSRQSDAAEAQLDRAQWVKVRRVMMGATFILIAVSGAPTLYIGGGLPPDRAQIIPLFLVVVVLLTCGAMDGLGSARSGKVSAKPWWRAALVVCVSIAIALGPLLLIVRTLSTASELQAYAAAMDDLDRQARGAHDAGAAELHIQRIRQPASIGLEQMGPNAASWPNTCVAAYYGLERISADVPIGSGPTFGRS